MIYTETNWEVCKCTETVREDERVNLRGGVEEEKRERTGEK